jgi:hypothetical protein
LLLSISFNSSSKPGFANGRRERKNIRRVGIHKHSTRRKTRLPRVRRRTCALLGSEKNRLDNFLDNWVLRKKGFCMRPCPSGTALPWPTGLVNSDPVLRVWMVVYTDCLQLRGQLTDCGVHAHI